MIVVDLPMVGARREAELGVAAESLHRVAHERYGTLQVKRVLGADEDVQLSG